MELSESTYNLINLMPYIAVVYEPEKNIVIACNKNSERILGLHVGSTYKDIKALAKNPYTVKKCISLL